MAFLTLHKLIELNPANSKYRGMLAELYSSLGMDSQSLNEYVQIFKSDPDNYTAHLSIAEYYRRKGMYDEAMLHYAHVFKNEEAGVADQVNIIYILLNDSIAIKNFAVPVSQLVETMIIKNREQVQARMVAADFFLRTENYERARHELLFLTQQFPENPDIWEQLVIVLSYLERYDEIVEIADTAMESAGDNAMIRYFKGLALTRLKQEEKAITELEKGLSLIKNNEDLAISFMIMMADTYYRMKYFEKSDLVFDEVIEKEPDNMIALNNYAYYLSERGERLEKALEMSRKAILKEPENSTYLDTYAWILFRKGEYEKALEYIEIAVKFLDEDNAEIFEHYGEILMKNGQKEKAIDYWRKALETDPERQYLIEKIK